MSNEISNINEIEIKINYLKQQTAENIIEIGNQLNAAKELVAHGEWDKWLEERINFSRSQAYNFMKVAEEFPNVHALGHLGQTKVFKLMTLPKEEREVFIENNNVQDMTTRQLNEEIKRLKAENTKLNETKPRIITEEIIKEVEVVKEVVPDDYNDLKEWFKKSVSKEHHANTAKLHEEAINQISTLEKQIEELGSNAVVEEHQRKLKTSALSFSMKTRDFIEDVGGFVFLTDFQKELDQVDRKIFKDTVLLLYGYAFNLHNQLEED